MSCTQRTVQDIFADEELDVMYAIAVFPTWEHSRHPTELPAPLAEWISTHCPGVVIEPITCLSGELQFHATEDTLYLDGMLLPHPMFRIVLNSEQADHFAQHWEVVTGGARDDFLFMEIKHASGTPHSPTDEDMRACIEDAQSHFRGELSAG